MVASCSIPLAITVSFKVVSSIAAVKIALLDVNDPCNS